MNPLKHPYRLGFVAFALAVLSSLLAWSCTQEQQNRLSRSIINWTGTNGVLDILSGGKVMHRFIAIDKITTAEATTGGRGERPYRFGYGVYDRNQNYAKDRDEKVVYFEFSDYSTEYVFYENPETP